MAGAFNAIWEFVVAQEQVLAFEQAYGPEGPWALLFAGQPGYLGSELWRDLETPSRYLTIDRWRSRADYEAFRQAEAERYASLDAACERLTRSERRIGAFVPAGRRPA